MKRLRLSAALACAAALLAALPALAPASVQVGSSGWQWGNPLPQGNTLRSISFAGANGYAAGDFGTLLRTTDGGTTWSGLLSGTFTNLSEVQAIDPDAVFAARRLRRAALERRRRHLHARGLHAGRVELQGAVRGRLVHQPRHRLPRADRRHHPAHRQQRRHLRPEEPAARAPALRAGRRPRSTCASSPTRSASARPRTARSTARPTARTRGASSATPPAPCARSSSSTPSNGFAVGDGSLFLVTKDGGATWTPKDIGIPPTNLRSISCATLTLCVMTTEPGTALVRTDDGGATATARHALARTRSSPPASPRRRASPRAAPPAPRRSPTTRG